MCEKCNGVGFVPCGTYSRETVGMFVPCNFCTSPHALVCAVADEWVPIFASGLGMDRALAAALDALELATRTSPFRKVTP